MKLAFATDQHCPFQDDRALDVALKVVSDFSPDLLVAGSDGIDFYAISSFDRDPERMKVGLQDELDVWTRTQVSWRDAAPKARRVYIQGNHEDRLRKYLWRHPELSTLNALRTENLLAFDELGIEQMEDDEIVINDLLVVKHGKYVRQHSGMSAKAEVEGEKFAVSTLTGHTHRGGIFYATTRNGVVQAAEGFCLCRLDPDYVTRPNWQQGIVLATITDEVVFEPVLISGVGTTRSAIFRGKEYRS